MLTPLLTLLAAVSPPQAVVELVYQAEPAAECADAVAFQQAVSGQVGFDPWGTGQTTTLHVNITRTEEARVATLELVERGDGHRGLRTVTSSAGSCQELMGVVVLASSLLVQGLATCPGVEAAPLPPPIPLETPAPAAAPAPLPPATPVAARVRQEPRHAAHSPALFRPWLFALLVPVTALGGGGVLGTAALVGMLVLTSAAGGVVGTYLLLRGSGVPSTTWGTTSL